MTATGCAGTGATASAARDTGIAPGTEHLFTGQLEDASIGLDWYASRGYDPALGRFTQADTLAPSLGDQPLARSSNAARSRPVGIVVTPRAPAPRSSCPPRARQAWRWSEGTPLAPTDCSGRHWQRPWHPHAYDRSEALAGALGPDPPAVAFHDLATNVESKP